MKMRLLTALLVLAVLSLHACNMKDAVSRISVELQMVHVTHMDKTGLNATLYVRVDNPNWFSVKVAGFRYTASVAGQEVARGEITREVDIPASGSATVELPVDVTYGTLKDRLGELLGGRLGYRVSGVLVLKTWLGSYTLPFDTDRRAGGKEGAGV